MFDLNDAMLEALLFAMENQDADFMIDAGDGGVVSLDGEAVPDGADLVEPPIWTSPDGFSVMESFAAGVGDPEARLALGASLSRGRGVFKAFKAALEGYPEVSRRWFEYKKSAMSRRVREWYDELRESRGLARLGPEPEDTDDLLSGDFSLRRAGRECWPQCVPLFRLGKDEVLGLFPEAVVEYEYAAMERELSEGGPDDLSLMVAEAPGGAIVAVAAARRVVVSGRSFGKLLFLFVAPEQRGLGLGRRLVELSRESLAGEGVARFLVDMPFMPDGFGRSLVAFGYEAFGTRWTRSGD